MEADAGKKYQKRDAGNDTREAFGCFSLRAFFGALTVFSVSLSGVFAAALFILVCVDRCFFVVCVRSCFFIRTVSSYRLACNRCQNILSGGQDQFVDGGEFLVKFTVFAFIGQGKDFDDFQCIRVFRNCVVQELLVRTKLSTISSVSASLGTV